MTESETSGIATRLRAARERRGWTREGLAFQSGISGSAIAQIESGRRRSPRPDTLFALSSALEVSLDYILRGRPTSPPMFEHHALIYDSDEEFVQTAGPFLAEGNERGEATLAVTNRNRIELLEELLGSGAGATEFAEAGPWYSDPGSALNRYWRFTNERLERGASWVRIVGEPIWEGRSAAEVRLWTRYESLLNLVFAASPVTLFCPYDASTVDAEIVKHAHVTHPRIAARSEIAASPDYRDPAVFVLDSE